MIAIRQLIIDGQFIYLRVRILPLVVLNSRVLLPMNVKPLKYEEFVAFFISSELLIMKIPLGVPFGIAETIARQS